MNAELVALVDIQRDADMMSRSSLDPEAVARYREAYEAGEALPPIQVVRERDGTLWLTDGWHRCAAAERLGIRDLAADVTPGDKADAYLLAAGHNTTHGRPRSKADIQAAIVVALRGLAAKAEPWSNRRLAELVKVSDMTIGRHLPMIEQTHPELFNTVAQQRSARSLAKTAVVDAQADDTDAPLLAVVDLETGEIADPNDSEDRDYRDVSRHALGGGLDRGRLGDVIDSRRRGRAITQPIEDLRNVLGVVAQIDPQEALQAWADTDHRDPLNEVLRSIAASIDLYAQAVEAAGQQRLRAVK